MTQKPTTQLWNSKKLNYASSSNGTSFPCKSKVGSEFVSSKPTKSVCNYEEKKNVHLYHKTRPISRKFQKSCGVMIKKKKKPNYAA